jgi:hypothetical protein
VKGIRHAVLSALLVATTALSSLAAPPAPEPRAKAVPARGQQPPAGMEGPASKSSTPAVLTGPKDGKAPYMAELKVTGVTKGTAVFWDVCVKVKTADGQQVWVESADVQTRILKTEQAFIFAGPRGEYRVRCRLVKGEEGEDHFSAVELTAGAAPAPPIPPKPPDPPVPPKPPDPPPTPATENPFGAAPGLRIMVVFESGDDAKRPNGEYLVLRGAKFRDYLEANCVADGYRIVDKDSKVTDPSAWYATGLKRTDRKSLPWLYVGKEASGLSVPLPKDPDETIKVIDKFLGK